MNAKLLIVGIVIGLFSFFWGCSNTTSVNDVSERSDALEIKSQQTEDVELAIAPFKTGFPNPPSSALFLKEQNKSIPSLGKTKAGGLDYVYIADIYFPSVPAGWAAGWNTSHWIVKNFGLEPYNIYWGDGSGNAKWDAVQDLRNIFTWARFFKTSGTGVDCGVLGRISPDGNSYYMAEMANNKLSIWKRFKNNSTYTFTMLKSVPCNVQIGKWYTLCLSIIDNAMEAALLDENGALILATNTGDTGETAITSGGKCGLRSCGKSVNVEWFAVFRLDVY